MAQAVEASNLNAGASMKWMGSPGAKIMTNSGAFSIQKLLECSVCTDLMYPPIHQCPNGHTLCSGCKYEAGNACPTCTSELGNIRCLVLEKVGAILEFPCRHKAEGCSKVFSYHKKAVHEAECPFRPYTCPYAGSDCRVSGDIATLIAHLRNEHRVDMHNGSCFNHRYIKPNPEDVESATWMLTVFNCYGHYFCLHFEAFNLGSGPVYMAFVRFMGNEEEAKNFQYCLEVGACGRKLIWQGVPRSIRENYRKVRDSLDGLIVYRDMAIFFSGGDRKELKLRVTGRIWRSHL